MTQPKYVRTPDGLVQFPGDMPDSEIESVLQREYGSEIKPKPSKMEVAGDVAKAGAAGFARGVADFAGLPGTLVDVTRAAPAWGLKKGFEAVTGRTPQFEAGGFERFFADAPEEYSPGDHPLGGAALRRGMSGITGRATEYEPQTMPGEYARTIGEFLPATVGSGIGGVARYGVVPALASETAGQATEDTALEPYARVGAGLLASTGAAASAQRKIKTPSAKEIKAQAGYDDFDMSSVRYSSPFYKKTVKKLIDAAEDFGLDEDVHGGIIKTLRRHYTEAQGNVAPTMQDLEIFRRQISNAGRNIQNPSAGELSGRLKDILDSNIAMAGTKDIRAGDAKGVLGQLKKAREAWRRGSKSQIVEDAIEDAQHQASGYENGLRIQFRRILKNKKLRRQFNETEIMAMQKLVDGTPLRNLARDISQGGVSLDSARGFLGPIMAAGAGATLMDLPGAIGAVTLATVMRKAGKVSTENAADIVEALVKSGKPGQQIYREIQALKSGQQRKALMRAFLQSRQALDNEDGMS